LGDTPTANPVKATVGAIITRQAQGDEEILLTERNIQPFAGQLCLPGGHIDRFETARDAVIREVKEEIGLDFYPKFFHYFDELIEELGWHAVVIIFTGSASGILTPQPEEVAAIRWLKMTNISSYQLAFKHNEIIQAYADHRHSAS
jgi:8-oxo-dGTP diphosphatase